MLAKERIFEGTWEELLGESDRLAGKRLRVEVLSSESDAASREGDRPPQNLAELLGNFIGSVEGTGELLYEQTGERFADYLQQKHSEGRL